ncbi:MAG: hypothetical protein HZB95_07120 [Nitrosomonadales bacterium]|nr:hypothetical protein [Nitrosomonadales bacterium]
MKKRLDVVVTLVVFVFLALYALWFTSETATNLLKGDDWRFLLSFYKKWVEGSLHLRDWFSDHHPIAWHPLVYIFNAEYFSLQRIYGAWLGFLLKTITGALLLWKMYDGVAPPVSKLLAVLFPLYVVLLFFGMNETAEYSWPLLGYVSSMSFFCGLVVLIVLDSILRAGRISLYKAAVFAFIVALSLLLMGTLMKLFLIASLLVLVMVSIAERKVSIREGMPFFIICLVLAFHNLFMRSLEISNSKSYPITFANIAELASNSFNTVQVVAYGLASGISSRAIFHYPSVAVDVLAIACLVIVAYSVVVFFQERLWQTTIIPIVLVMYLLLTFLGAIVYRAEAMGPDVWPMYVPRYFPTYHMGWIGVVWIYYFKLRLVSKRSIVLGAAALLSFGICMMLLGLVNAWRTKPHIEAANLKAEIAVCQYANGDLTTVDAIPFYIRGHYFSQVGVQLLKEKKLNIFSDNAMGYRCADLPGKQTSHSESSH